MVTLGTFGRLEPDIEDVGEVKKNYLKNLWGGAKS